MQRTTGTIQNGDICFFGRLQPYRHSGPRSREPNTIQGVRHIGFDLNATIPVVVGYTLISFHDVSIYIPHAMIADVEFRIADTSAAFSWHSCRTGFVVVVDEVYVRVRDGETRVRTAFVNSSSAIAIVVSPVENHVVSYIDESSSSCDSRIATGV